MLIIKHVLTNSVELDFVRDLFLEYSNELNENLCFQSFNEELENPLKKYGGPEGALLLACWNNEPAGCIALQPLQKGVCEMKRLYVRPLYRGHKIGDELVRILLEEAAKKGYQKMVLDTLERLHQALKLYAKYGFAETSAYYENPLSKVIYMQRDL